jgi:hypothetical protein
MEELFDPGCSDPFSPYLVTEDEAQTLTLVIGAFLFDTRSNKPTYPEDNIKYLEGYSIAHDTLDLVEKGQRILRTEADFYLVGISTRWFTRLFDQSINRDSYKATAQNLGILPEEFIEHAIRANNILRQIPDHIQSLLSNQT